MRPHALITFAILTACAGDDSPATDGGSSSSATDSSTADDGATSGGDDGVTPSDTPDHARGVQ